MALDPPNSSILEQLALKGLIILQTGASAKHTHLNLLNSITL